MKITTVECIPFTLPMRATLHFAAGTMADSRHVLLRVRTDEGITGTAEAISRPMFYGESQQSIVSAVNDWFGPALAGLDPFNTEEAWSRFDRVDGNHTAKGALDLAMHDIQGQALGVPACRLLGGYGTSAAVTYVCGLGGAEEVADEAERIGAAHGIGSFKLKVGMDPARDIAMTHAVRTRLPGATLYLDGNQGYRGHVARRVLDAAADLGVAWVEEPCAVSDRWGRRFVAARSPIPLLGDESCRTLAEVAREIGERTIHMVSIKVARTGYRVSGRIVGACLAAGVRPMTGSQGESGVGTLASLHFCVAHESLAGLPGELSFFLNLGDDLLAEPLRIVDGRLQVNERPGLGIEIEEAKLATLRLDR
jgi:L-alanine-DL-glutamate epimerase-like enolase superfamily enzyme